MAGRLAADGHVDERGHDVAAGAPVAAVVAEEDPDGDAGQRTVSEEVVAAVERELVDELQVERLVAVVGAEQYFVSRQRGFFLHIETCWMDIGTFSPPFRKISDKSRIFQISQL